MEGESQGEEKRRLLADGGWNSSRGPMGGCRRGWWELRNKRKSSRGDGAWLATGAVVLTIRHMAAGREVVQWM